MADHHEKFYIGTTRFTDVTWQENVAWRKKHNWELCMYGLNKKIPRCVPHLALVYVLEMNNDQNKIMGANFAPIPLRNLFLLISLSLYELNNTFSMLFTF